MKLLNRPKWVERLRKKCSKMILFVLNLETNERNDEHTMFTSFCKALKINCYNLLYQVILACLKTALLNYNSECFWIGTNFTMSLSKMHERRNSLDRIFSTHFIRVNRVRGTKAIMSFKFKQSAKIYTRPINEMNNHYIRRIQRLVIRLKPEESIMWKVVDSTTYNSYALTWDD